MEGIDQRADRKGVVSLLDRLQGVLGRLQTVHLEQETIGDVVARIIRRVGLAMHPV